MTGTIYHLTNDDRLLPMTEAPYESESLLQELLASYPSLLAGDQVNPTAPREWLLVRREAGVPSEEGGGNRWWLDHLFLDQDAIPTLVEVKRASDPRIRREVIGQMLDYAANAIAYWPVERLRADFEQECHSTGTDPDEAILGLRSGADSVEPFWKDVKTNLQAGRIRLVFVADQIPPELQRVVEFLNEQMDPAEVLALQVRQYVGEGRKTLVPTVLGLTAQAQQKKSSSRPSRTWDEASFFTEAESTDPEAAPILRRLFSWARESGLGLEFGTGVNRGSFYPHIIYSDGSGKWHQTFAAWTDGYIETQFQHLGNGLAFRDEAMRAELMRRLNAIPGIDLPTDHIARRPKFHCTVLADEAAMQEFLDVMNWTIEVARNYEPQEA